jgi:hypothetical protein
MSRPASADASKSGEYSTCEVARDLSASGLYRRRLLDAGRIVADDVHRFILAGNLGQTLRAAMIPTWLSSRAFGDPPSQRLPRPAKAFQGRSQRV